MNVKLATQVLSQTTANILFNYYPTETHGILRKVFDCLNVRNQTEHMKKRRKLSSLKNESDERFDWLEKDFFSII